MACPESSAAAGQSSGLAMKQQRPRRGAFRSVSGTNTNAGANDHRIATSRSTSKMVRGNDWKGA